MKKYLEMFNINTNVKIVILVSLILSVIGLSISFAAMTRNLKIKKELNIADARWNVGISAFSRPIINGSAEVIQNPDVTLSYFSNLKVLLTRPGDSVSYTFDIANKGNLNAVIDYVSYGSKDCKSVYGNVSDERIACDNVGYSLVYADTKEEVKKNDVFNKDVIRKVIYTIYYDQNATELPQQRVYVTGLDVMLNFVQSK